MVCPPFTSTSITLGTALPVMSMVASPGSAAKPSGHLNMDLAIKASQLFHYMSVSVPFHDHGNVSNLGSYDGLGSSVTPFQGLYRHPVVW